MVVFIRVSLKMIKSMEKVIILGRVDKHTKVTYLNFEGDFYEDSINGTGEFKYTNGCVY